MTIYSGDGQSSVGSHIVEPIRHTDIHDIARWLVRRAVLVDRLTLRQYEVGTLLLAGLTTKDVAKRLGVSVNSVYRHMCDLRTRLEVDTQLEAGALLTVHSLQDLVMVEAADCPNNFVGSGFENGNKKAPDMTDNHV